jgi:hypothetical protein
VSKNAALDGGKLASSHKLAVQISNNGSQSVDVEIADVPAASWVIPRGILHKLKVPV